MIRSVRSVNASTSTFPRGRSGPGYARINLSRPTRAYALQEEGFLDPEAIIRSLRFRHKQVYRFELHRAKLELLLQIARHRHLAPAKDYLDAIGEDFPHRMFQTTEHRSPKFPTRLWPPIARIENFATRLASLVLPTAAANKKRHETLQRFMLVSEYVHYYHEDRTHLGLGKQTPTGGCTAQGVVA